MFKRIAHIIVIVMLLSGITPVTAQVAMPDTVCVGTTRVYRVNTPATPSTYTWKVDGIVQSSVSNQLNITWTTPGIFLLTVQEHSTTGCDGDIRSGLVYVNAPPVPHAGADTILCFGTTARLAGSGGLLYQWSPSIYLSNPGIANPVLSIPVPGTYQYILDVSSNGCKSVVSDTVLITMLSPAKVFAGNDTAIAVNQLLQLNAIDITNSGFNSYTWSPAFSLTNSLIKNPVASPDRTITYIVTARNSFGCIAKDDITVKVFQKADLYVPTGFTPNGDGLNDFAVVIPAGIRELKYFSIFNRWGELVFTTKDASKGWNGTFRGQQQDGNVFVWTAEAIDYNGNIIRKKGTVTLIR